MNFLAHIYLSGDSDLVTIGNFMADGIKGKDYRKYERELQIGILLHREIDTYTDAHLTVRKSTKRLHEKYSHYSGVIVDILYDHFLAKNWNTYCDIPLNKYVDQFYDSLEAHFDILPLRIQKMMPYMITNNWLLSYASVEGIAKVVEKIILNKDYSPKPIKDNIYSFMMNYIKQHPTDQSNELLILLQENYADELTNSVAANCLSPISVDTSKRWLLSSTKSWKKLLSGAITTR